MSSPNDYLIHAPQSEHCAIMEALKDYRCQQEQSDDDGLWLQGHPGMFEVLQRLFDYDFTESFIGTNFDLMVHYSKLNGEWTENLEMEWHGWAPEFCKTLSIAQFNEALDNRFNDEWTLG